MNYSKAAPFINEDELETEEAQVAAAKKLLVDRSGAGNDFLGWIDLPVNYDKEEFARIQQAAKKIQEDSEVLVCHRYWWFLSGCPRSHRIFETQLL